MCGKARSNELAPTGLNTAEVEGHANGCASARTKPSSALITRSHGVRPERDPGLAEPSARASNAGEVSWGYLLSNPKLTNAGTSQAQTHSLGSLTQSSCSIERLLGGMALELPVNEREHVRRIARQVLIIRGDQRTCRLKVLKNALDRLPFVKSRYFSGSRCVINANASYTDSELAKTRKCGNLFAFQ